MSHTAAMILQVDTSPTNPFHLSNKLFLSKSAFVALQHSLLNEQLAPGRLCRIHWYIRYR